MTIVPRMGHLALRTVHPFTQRISRVLATAALLVCVGCQAMMAPTIQETLDSYSKFARENKVRMTMQINYSGRGGLYVQQLYGIDTGLNMQMFATFEPDGTVALSAFPPGAK